MGRTATRGSSGPLITRVFNSSQEGVPLSVLSYEPAQEQELHLRPSGPPPPSPGGLPLAALRQASTAVGVVVSVVTQNPLARMVCFKLGNEIASQ